jgi:DNA-binding response OmpR family regulator
MTVKPAILVAEDDSTMRQWLVKVLSPIARRIHPVANGAEIWAVLSAHEIDVVVSDVRMPVQSGVDALLCARGAGIQVPFILITGFGGDDDLRVVAARYGADVLEKPFGAEELRAHVTRLHGTSNHAAGERAGPFGPAERPGS